MQEMDSPKAASGRFRENAKKKFLSENFVRLSAHPQSVLRLPQRVSDQVFTQATRESLVSLTQSTTSIETVDLTSSVVVAHVVLNLEVGGLERVVANLVSRLRGTRFQPVVFCLEGGGFFAQEIEGMGIPVHTINRAPGISWNAIKQLAQHFRKYKVQIVHTHSPAPHLHGMIAALLTRVPVRVHTKHGRDFPHIWRKVWVNRISAWMTDVVVPVSDDTLDVAVRTERANPRKVRRIWNGVDTDLYKPVERLKPSVECNRLQPSTLDSQPLVIGTVARLAPVKDQKTMLAAFQLVVKELPEARLVICGDGPCETELRDTSDKLGVADRVTFLGNRSDIKSVLNTFSLFTLSSVSEGLSMTILEAMACGLPVVATDVGGNRESVNPPECGLIVPPKDPRALADAYLRLARDPMESARMGIAARARAVSHFSMETMVAEYVHLYESLLARKAGH
jgi:sugar transferase (PEP-CTERM/EpsH1 system associated)